MQHELKKVTVIINEIITMLFLKGAEDVDVKIRKKEGRTEISITHFNCEFGNDFLEQLRFDLSAQRQNEVEGYYWQLVGENDSSEELHLVGAMIDEAQVKLEDHNMVIQLVRKCT